MDKKIAFFHSTFNTPAIMREAFTARFPEVPLINIADDSILPVVISNGNKPTSGIVRKLISFALNAQMQGAVAAVCMCTTLGEAVEAAAKAVDIPFVTIDGPMLEAAAKAGKRTAILVTAPTTITATTAAAYAAAKRAGCDGTQPEVILVEGTFDALNKEKDIEKHDRLISQAARNAAKDYDSVVLAQVTMAHIAAQLTDLPVPVFTSVESGIEQLAKWL